MHHIREDCSEASPRADEVAISSLEMPIQEADHEGHSFTLPDFGPLHDAILKNSFVTSNLSIQIIETMYQAMVKLTIYPSRKFYIKAINLLVTKYPSLADVTGTGYVSHG